MRDEKKIWQAIDDLLTRVNSLEARILSMKEETYSAPPRPSDNNTYSGGTPWRNTNHL